MRMAFKSSHKPAIYFVSTLILMTAACSAAGSPQNTSPDANPQPVATSPATAAQPEGPVQATASQPTQPAQAPASGDNARADCLEGIYPGKTGKSEVIALLGEPAAVQQDGSHEALQYISPTKGQYNTVYLTDQVVERVSVVLPESDPLTWSEVSAWYGEPAHTAFSDYLPGSQYFAYPEQGLSFIADADLDIVFLRECFAPMPLEDYLNAYGDALLMEDPFTK